jgi:hypothetical protein
MALQTEWIFRVGSGYYIAAAGADCVPESFACDGETDQDREKRETLRIVNDVKANVEKGGGKGRGKQQSNLPRTETSGMYHGCMPSWKRSTQMKIGSYSDVDLA